MRLMVCLDNGCGICFFGRRQSMDSVLRQKAAALAGDSPLWMDAYSAGQFRDLEEKIRVTDAPLEEVPHDGWFFFELGDPEPLLPETKMLAVFRWNRDYPADRRFPLERMTQNAVLCHREEFPGSSHECITLEVYRL